MVRGMLEMFDRCGRTPAFGCESRFLTLPPAVHGSPMWPSREEDTMTTPTIAEVAHGIKQDQIRNSTGSLRREVLMRFKRLAIVTVLVGGAAMGYGGVEHDASTTQVALTPDLHDLRRAFRHATAIYHDTDRLEPNGWVRLQETC